MSKYSDYIKSLKENFKTKFFGEVTNWSNKYFTFNHILDDDNIIVFTKNVKTIKGSPALIVGRNKAIFLKDWLVIGVRNYEIGFEDYEPSDPFKDENFDVNKLWMIVGRNDANEFVRYNIIKCNWNLKWVARVNGENRILNVWSAIRNANSYTS